MNVKMKLSLIWNDDRTKRIRKGIVKVLFKILTVLLDRIILELFKLF